MNRPSLLGSGPGRSRNSIPAFLIVGTGRSGTTLVQRLACEVPGVRMPPETHFFWSFAPRLLRRRTFPLDQATLREELQHFTALGTSRNLGLNLDEIDEYLGGRCHGVIDLFGAIIRQLAGPGEVYGEKTPRHLLWWRPLTQALPHLKIVAVVRDPRAVVASHLAVPWGDKSHVRLAERWNLDQREIEAAVSALGPRRCLVLRYEDVVGDPESTLIQLAGFLGVSVEARVPAAYAPAAGSKIVLEREWWKSRALEQITTERTSAWRTSLTPKQVADITLICGREMARFGYDGTEQGRRRILRFVALGPSVHLWRYRVLISRRRQLRRIQKMGRSVA